MTDITPITVYASAREHWDALCVEEASASRDARKLFPLPTQGWNYPKIMEMSEAQMAYIRARRRAWEATHKLADDVTPLVAYRLGDATHREACGP